MKEHPILFSTPMVRAILEGRKTQTRRVIKPQPCSNVVCCGSFWRPRPYGNVSDRLWVRETWAPSPPYRSVVLYRASYDGNPEWVKWKSPLHMPRWATRLTLEIVHLRVERVQEISGNDAREEGVAFLSHDETTPRSSDERVQQFCVLWDSINAKRGFGWAQNPWVWVIGFKRVPKESVP